MKLFGICSAFSFPLNVLLKVSSDQLTPTHDRKRKKGELGNYTVGFMRQCNLQLGPRQRLTSVMTGAMAPQKDHTYVRSLYIADKGVRIGLRRHHGHVEPKRLVNTMGNHPYNIMHSCIR